MKNEGERSAAIDAALDHAPLLIALLDGEGRYIDARGAWHELLGWSKEEIVGKRPSDLIHPDDQLEVERILAEGRTSGLTPRQLDLRMVTKDGGYRWIAWSGPGRQVSGGLVGIGFDLSAEREARDAALQARELLRSVLDAAPDYITQVDLDGVITFINRTYPGVTREQVIGTKLTNWLAPADRSTFEQALARIAGGSEAERVIVVGSGESGPTWYQSRLGPVREGGAVVGVTIVGTDITGERRAEIGRHQRTRLEALGLLTGGVAHDINNMIAVIKFAVEAALETCAEPDTRALLDDVAEATERCTRLTRKLLVRSVAEGSMSPELDLCEAARDAGSLVSRLLGPQISFSMEIPPTELWVRLTGVEFEQILANLASNTRHAITDQGSVRCVVRAGQDGDPVLRSGARPAAVLIFADDGPGMSWETQSRAFEPFFTVGDHAGTGIGLATVYGIVQAGGGETVLKSAPEEGASFTFYFADAQRSPPVIPVTGTASGGTETILVVDDEAALRSTAARYLSRLGYRVLEASSADDAESVVRAHPGRVDLVVSDLRMPGRDGFALVRSLRARVPGLLTIFMTGYEHSNDKESAQGATILRKPFSLTELAGAVRATLDARK